MMIHVIKTPQEMQHWALQQQGKTIGFVPTMGALHDGHSSLIHRACKENDLTVLSIFVNPTQFNNKIDLEKYPRTWEEDLEVARRAGVDVVFAPQFEQMYPDSYRYKISENEFSLDLCGRDRPGHFDGVLSIVMKLFQLVRPTRSYFGEKDFQQLQLIQGLVKAFFLTTEIVAVPTLRETDGLAMSSRNVRLSKAERALAPKIYQAISESSSADQARSRLTEQGFEVDYVKDFNGRRYVAAKLGEVRLIDNVSI
jgi:pantoate--beta-alanine ligase